MQGKELNPRTKSVHQIEYAKIETQNVCKIMSRM